MRYALITLVFLTLAGSARAGNTGVLLKVVPHAENASAVLAAVREGFLGRGWTVVAADNTSVTATLDHNRIESRMRVWLAGQSLMYEETSTRMRTSSHAPNGTYSESREPFKLDSWVENLQVDIGRRVSGIPSVAQPVVSADPASRLKTLEQLRASGLISEDEYAKKRAEILKAL